MNIYALILLLGLFVYAALFSLALRHRHKRERTAFTLYLAAAGFWSFVSFLLHLENSFLLYMPDGPLFSSPMSTAVISVSALNVERIPRTAFLGCGCAEAARFSHFWPMSRRCSMRSFLIPIRRGLHSGKRSETILRPTEWSCSVPW